MKTLIKYALVAGFVGLLAVPKVEAFNITIDRHSGYFSGAGGEFTVQINDPAYLWILNNYDASTKYGSSGFQTFCIDTGVHLLSNPQDATLDPNGVAQGTAWLYYRFVHQTLSGYDYTVGSGRADSAFALQQAIWKLQGFSYYGTLTLAQTTAANAFYNMAVTALGSQATDKSILNPSGIDAMRLTYTDSNGTHVSQPMLVDVTDGGAVMVLMGIGLSGLSLFSRRMRA